MMKVFLGADHRGYEMKGKIKAWLAERGVEVEDMGARVYQADDDEVDYVQAVVEAMGEDDRGILFCGTGQGMSMAANRYAHVRSMVGFRVEVAKLGREHNDANVLSVPAEWVEEEQVRAMIEVFLGSDFSGKERYVRRLRKLEELGKVER